MLTTTAYVVTAGSYSDYHIIGVCSTREKAEALRDIQSSDAEANIEEFDIDVVPPHRPGWRWWSVCLNRDTGDLMRFGLGHFAPSPPYAPRDLGANLSEYTPSIAVRESRFDPLTAGQSYYEVRCLARSKEHAIKIAGEMRRAHLAHGNLEAALAIAEAEGREPDPC